MGRLFVQVMTWQTTLAVIGSKESYLGNKTLVGTWSVIVESGFVQLLINVYKMKIKHQSKKYVSLEDFFSGMHQNIQKAWELVDVRTCQEIIVFPN